jgi:branched-chain amino acid transport system substrate-binding protein
MLASDNAAGRALERDAAGAVTAAGGKVLGTLRHPFNAQDFSSYLMQARASNAKVIGLANGGGDTIHAIKQAAEFGIMAGGQRLAGLLVFPSDVHALGLETAQGLIVTSAWDWDQDENSRAFARRFMARNDGVPPNSIQAGVYSAITHYLRAIERVGTDDADRVGSQMRKMKIDDFMTRNGRIREDGRIMRDMFLQEVKSPAQSRYPFDYFKTLAKIRAEAAFRSLEEGGCRHAGKS